MYIPLLVLCTKIYLFDNMEKFETTPEKSTGKCTINCSPIKSPVPITLGFDDESTHKLLEEMLALFESPMKPISSLPSTPKKRKTEASKPSEKTKKYGRSFLMKETDISLSQRKIWRTRRQDSWQLHLWPILRGCCQGLCITEKAKRSDMFSGSEIPDGIGGVKKIEKVILPDGTIYELSAYRIPDPTCT